MTQWLLCMTLSAKSTSVSPRRRKPRDRQMPFEGALPVVGKAVVLPEPMGIELDTEILKNYVR